jgi:antigen flippase
MRRLIRATFQTAAGTITGLLFNALTAKVIATVLGPSGLGLYSILRQTQQTATTLGSFGGQTAVTQGISCRHGPVQRTFTATALGLFLVGAFATAALLVLLAPWLSRAILANPTHDHVSLLRWLALPSFFAILGAFFAGLLNGKHAIGWLAAIQAASAGASAVAVLPAAWIAARGHPHALIGLLWISAATGLLLSYWRANRSGWIGNVPRKQWFDYTAAREFVAVASTSLLSGLAFAASVLAIRALIVRSEGIATAGMFDAAWTISMGYVGALLSSFVSYYLPTLARHRGRRRGTVIRRMLHFCIVCATPFIVVALTLKVLIIRLLYSSQFDAATLLLQWLLVGDFLLVTNWVFGITMAAYADTRTGRWVAVLMPLALFTLAWFAVGVSGSFTAIGPVFVAVQLGYMLFLLYYVIVRHHFIADLRIILNWLAACAVIVATAWHTWSIASSSWSATALWSSVALILSWSSLTRSERRKLLSYIRR